MNIPWHQIVGLWLADLFYGTGYEIELEKDLSMREQLLDILVIQRRQGPLPEMLPDGLDDLPDHTLITYKSIHQPLDGWALQELEGHYVNYRKQVSPARGSLIPRSSFLRIGISTRFPKSLASAVAMEQRQPGVYEVTWGIDRIRVLVLKEMPETEQNLFWDFFKANASRLKAALHGYRPRNPHLSGRVKLLRVKYQEEGYDMTLTIKELEARVDAELLKMIPIEERLRGVPLEERLRGVPLEERLRGVPLEEMARLLSTDQQQQLIKLLQRKKSPRRPRGGSKK